MALALALLAVAQLSALDREAARTVFEFPPAPPAALRRSVELAGVWRFGGAAGVRVPAPTLQPGAYRARFRAPADGLMLRVTSTFSSVTVAVDGVPCGSAASPGVPTSFDLSRAAKPGAVQELVIEAAGAGGFLGPPTLVAVGPVYAADVLTRPHVAAKELGVEVMVRNPRPDVATVEVRPVVRPLDPDGRPVRGKPAKAFAPRAVTIPAGGEVPVAFREAWPSARPWWPDDPQRYAVEVVLALDGRPADESVTPFGFREWTSDGGRLSLNGVPFRLRGLAGPTPPPDLRAWRRGGFTHLHPGEAVSPAVLEECDRLGVPVRLPPAWVRAGRNHPCAIDAEIPPRSLFADPFAAVGGVGLGDEMLVAKIEADRWAGGPGFELPADPGLGPLWLPVAVLARGWQPTLPNGPRTLTLKLLNDTRFTSPITVHWLLQGRGGPVTQVRGKRVVTLAAGGAVEFAVELPLPATPEAELILTAERDGREVFRAVKRTRVIPAAAVDAGRPPG